MLRPAHEFCNPSAIVDILAVINPCSGSGKAEQFFESKVKPIWEKRGIKFFPLYTGYAGQCTAMIRDDENILRFKSIVAIGGDGTLAEIINGLIANKWVKNAEKKILLGIIPVGSGNGLAVSLHLHAKRKFSIEEAAKMTAIAKTENLDMIEVTQNGAKRLSFLAVTFGAIADADINSEKFRRFGELRFILGAINTIWHNKAYQAQLCYLPEGSVCEKKMSESSFQPHPANLKTIAGHFSLVMIGNTSHCAKDVHTSPGARLDDGYMHVTTVRKITRLSLFLLFLSLKSGKWINGSLIERFRTKYICIEELSHDTILTVDGEKVKDPVPSTVCRIHQAALRVHCNSD